MPALFPRTNLEQLRHQAKDLLAAAKACDEEALARIRALSDRLQLSSAQLALAARSRRRRALVEQARVDIEGTLHARPYFSAERMGKVAYLASISGIESICARIRRANRWP
jgi:hypothetical protein